MESRTPRRPHRRRHSLPASVASRCAASAMTSAPLAEREPDQRRGRLDRRRRRRSGSRRPRTARAAPAELGRVAADVGVDEVGAGRDEWTQTGRLEPRAQLVALDPEVVARRREVWRGRRSAAAAACCRGVPPANVRYCLTMRAAATSCSRAGAPADLPAGERERLADARDRQRALASSPGTWRSGCARRRRRGARRPRR